VKFGVGWGLKINLPNCLKGGPNDRRRRLSSELDYMTQNRHFIEMLPKHWFVISVHQLGISSHLCHPTIDHGRQSKVLKGIKYVDFMVSYLMNLSLNSQFSTHNTQ